MLWTAGFSIMKKAIVNKIIRFSNVDGPGNRTAIFFQGCNFNCQFCHNPETIHHCNACGTCVAACPAGALALCGGTVVWDEKSCVQCDTCLKVCPHSASPKTRAMTVEEILREVRRTAPYISGITCSGGECTLEVEFLIELFTQVQKMGLGCLIDSNGSFDFSSDPRILAVCDGVMLDVKAVDPHWSRELVGFPPDLVLRNLDHLLQAGKLQEVRTVLFPSRDVENEETVRYVAERIGNRCLYKLICYRPFGVREQHQKLLGEDCTDPAYAEQYAALARSLGVEKATVI